MEHTLGIELKTRREARGMRVDDLARAAHISAQYIRALEENGYHLFPAKIYAQGAVRRMGNIFEDGDTEALVALLNREWPNGIGEYRYTNASRFFGFSRHLSELRLTPRRIGMIAAGAFILLLTGFWGLRLFVFSTPPRLTVKSPAPYARITASTAVIQGSTERESRLTVNGREIKIDERGNFNTDIELQTGVNELHFSSESRFGKTSHETRYVFVE